MNKPEWMPENPYLIPKSKQSINPEATSTYSTLSVGFTKGSVAGAKAVLKHLYSLTENGGAIMSFELKRMLKEISND